MIIMDMRKNTLLSILFEIPYKSSLTILQNWDAILYPDRSFLFFFFFFHSIVIAAETKTLHKIVARDHLLLFMM